MGTDIHGVFQKYDDGWRDVASVYEQRRHYQLFAVLAGVRNGTGFAGIRMGEPVNPIAEPRGLPPDFAERGAVHPVAELAYMDPISRKYRQPDEPLEVWMGDHSFSWLTGEEMLLWFEAAPCVVKTGILERSVYEKWDGESEPAGYCGGITGPSVRLVNDNAVERSRTPNWTHIQCEWTSKLHDELRYFFDEVARLVAEHGRIRFVFGFDS